MRQQGKLAACCSFVFCFVTAAHAAPLVIGIQFAGELGGALRATQSAGVVPQVNWNVTSKDNGTANSWARRIDQWWRR